MVRVAGTSKVESEKRRGKKNRKKSQSKVFLALPCDLAHAAPPKMQNGQLQSYGAEHGRQRAEEEEKRAKMGSTIAKT